MEQTVEFAHATGALSGIWLLVAIPLASAAVLLLLGKRADKWGHWLGVLAVAVPFVLGLVFFISLKGLSGNRSAELSMWKFIAVGGLHVDFGMLFDPLSGVFVLLITGVGSLIHLYAVGYMEHDPGRRKFFAYFNLFVAAMLLLVLGNNYVMLYFGWEGVGLASYLLISFWYLRPSAATAGKKAFLMNRVGDAGLAIGIFLMFATLGSTQYSDVFNGVGRLSSTTVLILGILLLLGAAGKSGQFPLQAWLPDAMEGPTPVSALIHAATMVTAGVYLIARSNHIFSANHTLQTIVVSVGALTLLMGCIIGAAKDDIKRVLAWSTVSQIGYMFLGVGLGGGAYALAIIHLLAHGFFKANMFLGAGSVMHGMHDQVDIRRFGGLRKYMKWTWLTFMMGWLAIIGIPPLSGYFSKDPIIEAAFARGDWTSWLYGFAALLGAGLTAFYMTRLFVLTFHGPERYTEENKHPHESPFIMTVPLMLLAVGSIAAGGLLKLGVPDWLAPVTGEGEHNPVMAGWLISALALVLSVAGAGIAWAMFRRGTALAPEPAGVVVTAARRNLYTDAFNEAVFERPGVYLTRALVYLDNKGIDGLVNGIAAGIGGSSGRIRRLQTGFVRSYALSMLTGAVLVVGAFLAIQLWVVGVNNFPFLTILTLLPLVGAIVVAVIPRDKGELAKQVALGWSLVVLVLSIVMWIAFKVGGDRFQFRDTYAWIPSWGARFTFAADGIGLVMLMLVAILTPVVILASWHDVDESKRSVPTYFALLLAFEFTMIGVFAAADVFLFYVFFEVMLIPMYFIIGSFGGPRRQYAAVKFFLYSLVGGLFMLAAVIGLWVVGGKTFDFNHLLASASSIDQNTARWLFLGFFVAFAIKAPFFPFHTWLPDAGGAAPAGAAALLVGVMDKVGTFGILRYCLPLFPEASRWFAPAAIVLAVIGIIYAALLAVGQNDLKRLVSYTSIAHFGFIGIGIFAFTTQGGTGSVLYMVNHGLATGLLFIVVGMLVARRGSNLVSDFGGAGKTLPVLAGVLFFAGLASLALPGTAPFISEFLVLIGTFTVHKAYAVIATAGIVLAAAYVLWMIQRTTQGTPNPALAEVPAMRKDLTLREKVVVAPLILLLLFLGFYPKPVTDVINPAVQATMHDVGTTDPGPTAVANGKAR